MSTRILVLAVLCVSPLTASCDRSQADVETAPPVPLVEVQPVQTLDVAPSTPFIGRAEAIEAVDVKARVTGALRAVRFREGQDIRAGQALFEIESERYAAIAAQRRAGVERARAVLVNAQLKLTRQQELVRSSAVALAQVDAARADRDAARADLALAEANLRDALLDVSYTRISSPIAGRAGAYAVTPGNVVAPDSPPLVRIVRLHPMRVVFSIPQRELTRAKLATGLFDQDALNARFEPRLILPGQDQSERVGRVQFVNNEADPRTGTVTVRALFDNADGAILPGQFVSISVRPADRDVRPVVPAGAVLRDQQGTAVMLLGVDGRAHRRPVRLDRQQDQSYPVLQGLSGGERLIVSGLGQVRDNAPVRLALAKPADARGQVSQP